MVQTPQAFDFNALIDAHQRAQAAGGRDDFTDDAALAEWAGLKVATFEGETANVKLTTEEDFQSAQRLTPARRARAMCEPASASMSTSSPPAIT